MGRTILLMLLSLAIFGQAHKWESPFQGGQLVYSCVGKRVTFPFDFTLEKGENILFIRWTFDGYFSSESMATLTPFPEHFQPADDYDNRVSQVGNAGIALDNVTLADDGNYSVEVSGLDGSGGYFTLLGMAVLQIGDKLLAEGGEVKVTQLSEAIKVKDTGRWSVALACGKFRHLGVPPFPVYWTTPSGEVIKESSSYTDGHYTLLLPNPVRGGNYSCHIPHLFADDACLSGESNDKTEATVVVDEIHARLSLLEAHQAELLKENEDLNIRLAQDAVTIQDLNSTLALKTEELNLKVEDMVTPRIAFNAQSTKSQTLSSPSHVQFDNVLYNQGNGYNVNTGDFTAPVNGTYFFIFHTRSTSGKYADSHMMANNQIVCTVYIFRTSYHHGSCHAVVHLRAGESVWIVPTSDNLFYTQITTSFAGYLISDDPK